MYFRYFSNTRAFTLIETMFAVLVFGILIVVLFNLITYVGRISRDNRDTVTISQRQETGISLIKARKSHLGWISFLDAYMGKGTFAITPVWSGTSITGYTYATAPATTQQDLEWRFTITADNNLGPYLSQITNSGGTYQFIFSKPILTQSIELSDILPVVNTHTRSWTTQTVSPALDTFIDSPLSTSPLSPLSITLVSAPTEPFSGDTVLASRDITDDSGNADISYSGGVAIPVVNATSIGYPSIAKITLRVMVNGTSYAVTNYISEKEFE